MHAPVDRCFDLARSIDLHQDSVSATSEKAISGVVNGVIWMGEEVEWRARHFGLWLKMRVRITAFKRPVYFQDTMIKGPFRYFQHDHQFEKQNGGTLMVDRLEFQSPVPLAGAIVDAMFIKAHLRRFVETRNQILKAIAESDQWHKYLLT